MKKKMVKKYKKIEKCNIHKILKHNGFCEKCANENFKDNQV